MKKQKSNFSKSLHAGMASLLIGLLVHLSAGTVQAQDSGGYYSFDNSQKIQDITVPNGYSYISLNVKGADGGQGTETGNYGGEGARVVGYLSIGTGSGKVPVGSTLRLIPGQVGGTNKYFGGGGGGTGVAFKGPGANDSWQLLAVAGGGGGGGWAGSGKAATSYSFGLAGLDDNGNSEANAGKDGNGGTHKGSEAYPGGGAFSDGGGGCPGRAGYQNNVPTGGLGGGTNCGDPNYVVRGGFGFGGGGTAIGSADNLGAGGGGGGYSGGGGGYAGHTTFQGSGGGPGGSGGSYSNTSYMSPSFIQSFGTAAAPMDGYVSCYFTNAQPVKTIKLASDQTKCIDDFSTATINGNNIQLYHYTGAASQQWAINGSAIHLAKDLNKCMDLANSKTNDGNNIRLWDCNGTNAQNWIYDVGSQAIRSVLDFNKCLDLTHSNTADHTNIQLYTCNNTGAQKWLVSDLPSAMPTGTNHRIHLAVDFNKCVDVKNAHTSNGTNIQLNTCTTGNSQYFFFDGRRIKMQASPDKCISPDPNSKAGTAPNVILLSCYGNNLQEWIYDGFAQAFRSAINTNMCLDVDHSSTADGTNIQLFECNGTAAQQFSFVEDSSILCSNDVTPPVAKCKGFTNTANIIPTAAIIDNGSYDNCSISSMQLKSTGFHKYQLTVTDPSGNSSSCTATVN